MLFRLVSYSHRIFCSAAHSYEERCARARALNKTNRHHHHFARRSILLFYKYEFCVNVFFVSVGD